MELRSSITERINSRAGSAVNLDQLINILRKEADTIEQMKEQGVRLERRQDENYFVCSEEIAKKFDISPA